MKKIIAAALSSLFASITSVAMACGTGGCNVPPPTNGCGPTGCYAADGKMQIWVSNHTEAYGSDVLAAAGANYNFTSNLGYDANLDAQDYVNLNGGFLSVSEGHGFEQAGGFSGGEAVWSKLIRW